MSEAVESARTSSDSKYMRERAGTELVNQKHVDTYDVDIGRHDGGSAHLKSVEEPGAPGWLGNPHPVEDHGECGICYETHTREESVRAFREDFREKLRHDTQFRQAVEDLKGDRLACWCVPEYCHGDLILEFLDRGEEALLRWENDSLREQMETIRNITLPAFSKFINVVNGAGSGGKGVNFEDPEMMTAAIDAAEAINERGDRLNTVEGTVERHESEIQEGKAVASDEQGEHWMHVVEMAHNVDGMQANTLPDNRVILYKEDVAKAIKPGMKRASQLIDEWTNTDSGKYKQGTEKQSYKPPAESRKGSSQKKGIKIDLDVWSDSDE